MIDYLIFLFYKFVRFFILAIPKKFIKLFLDGLSFLIYSINKEHKKYAIANLDFVYKDELTKDEKINIVKNSYRNIIYNLYEFLENRTLSVSKLKKKIIIENEHCVLDALKNKRKIILITAHYGNWELGNLYIPIVYGPTTMVGRPMNNKYFNSEIDKTRTKNNTIMLSKQNAARGLVAALKEDRIVGLVIDQHNSKGIDVNFLNHKVKQTDSSSKLAIKFDALIIPIFFTMNSFGKYTLKFYEPIDHRLFDDNNKILNLTQAQADVMSKHVLLEPNQWFWHHKRFKEYHNNIYK